MSFNDLRRGRVSLPGHVYFITTVTVHRRPFFRDLRSARTVVDGMRQRHAAGDVSSLAWVIMPDHVHWLFQLGEEAELSTVIGRFKGQTAREINRLRGTNGRIWQPAFHDHALRREEDVREIARYIVANPLRAGLVSRLGDYSHWDAIWL